MCPVDVTRIDLSLPRFVPDPIVQLEKAAFLAVTSPRHTALRILL
jgi:hypothetical protein